MKIAHLQNIESSITSSDPKIELEEMGWHNELSAENKAVMMKKLMMQTLFNSISTVTNLALD